MFAVFEKSIAKPPKELGLPSSKGLRKSLSREQILENFRSSWNEPTVYNLANRNFIALSHDDYSAEHPRSIVVIDDVLCMFIGSLENTSDLRCHYGLYRQATAAIVVVEACKVLRDRAPYPTDQVIKDLHGDFAFVLFDAASGTLSAARNRNGSIECHRGLTGDGFLVFSNNPNIIEEACGQSHSPFPAGCIFKNGSELISFDHPPHKVRAIAYEDDDGNISRVIFQVDLYTLDSTALCTLAVRRIGQTKLLPFSRENCDQIRKISVLVTQKNDQHMLQTSLLTLNETAKQFGITAVFSYTTLRSHHDIII